jgi:4-hydroxyacetophenone monooxygenase
VPLAAPPSPPVDEARLRAAVESANLPTLLMSLFQLTGDRKWLQAPYRPTRTKGMSDHDTGGLDEGTQREIREAAIDAVLRWAAGEPAAVPGPQDELLLEMMSICMGEEVPGAYAPMMAEEMGFVADDESPVGSATNRDFSVIVIGAGVSGLMAALRLRRAGIDHVVLERTTTVGGTWLTNRYPGCGVDTPSYLYSFSFFPHRWSTYFGKRPEVASYVRGMAEHFDLLPSVRLGVEVTSAAYDERSQRWAVTCVDASGRRSELTANAVITAVGQLNRPKVPQLPGMDSFQGRLFHSAHWPDDVDVTGKRVAVVGTGASAMQIVPAIADRVGQLTVVQRSPQWATPNPNYFRPVADDVHWLMENVPYYHEWYRFRLAYSFNDKVHPALQIDPAWPHQDRSINAQNDKHRQFLTDYLLQQLEGREDLKAKALPDYPPFGKRMLIDNGWFAALRRPNVELLTDRVVAVTENGITLASGEHREADVIVFATGFEAQRPLHPLEIRGRAGLSLADVWGDDDPRAYLGMTAPGFPNLFFTYGPNTNLGHGGSFLTLAEAQTRYIVDLLAQMADQRIGAVECRRDVHDEYNARLDEAHSTMIWSHPGMSSWYRNPQGRVVTNMPWRVVDYWHMVRTPDLQDYELESAAVGETVR